MVYYNAVDLLTVGTNPEKVITLEESPSSLRTELEENEKESLSMSLVVVLPCTHEDEEVS